MDDNGVAPISDEEEVVDGEVLGTVASTENAETVDQSNVLTSLDELIKTYVQSLDRMREEKNKISEMLTDGFNNDAAYKEADNKAKEAAKGRAAIKKEIMGRTGVIELVNKLKDIGSEMKEKQASLSDYLLEYQRLAGGVNQIDLGNGEILEIVNSARIVRKSSK